MKISHHFRMLAAIAAVSLVSLYALPLWSIDMTAPQYPEGLGLVIKASTIQGRSANDLGTINELNHYIGMKAIDPDSVPELRVMPWAIAGLALIGLGAALTGRPLALGAWLGAFLVAGAAGMVQFWRWGYDYGHNLAPDAIIKVPGMAYQPPLLGTKTMLNITASSWPAVGGYVAAAAFVAGALALWLGVREARARAA
jgi:hypothetical protein